jgi:hypothetical protein
MTGLFSDPPVQDNEQEINATIETLKTKYQKEDGSLDLDGLLKKAAHAERHIKTLEREAQERSKESKVAQTLEEILAKIEAKTLNSGGEPNHQTETPNSPRETTNTMDLDKLLEQRLEEKLQRYEAQKTYERNVQHVQNELMKEWGPDYLTKLKAKAQELGETEQFLNDLAATRPQTFLKLVKDKPQGSVFDGFTPPPGQRLSSTSSGASGPKTYSDFEKIRKENPTLYRSKAIQDQLLKLTAEYAAQGKSFTNT